VSIAGSIRPPLLSTAIVHLIRELTSVQDFSAQLSGSLYSTIDPLAQPHWLGLSTRRGAIVAYFIIVFCATFNALQLTVSEICHFYACSVNLCGWLRFFSPTMVCYRRWMADWRIISVRVPSSIIFRLLESVTSVPCDTDA
jgi:hypothetical protein